jgi:tRNA(Ile)-lysidine synthase
MKSWGNLEHRVWNELNEHGLQQKNNFAIAVSGGLDSVVLLDVFLRIKPQSHIKVLHFHHGPSSDEQLNLFRSESERLVRSIVEAQANNTVIFINERSLVALKSEEDCRDARWNFIRRNLQNDEVLVTAHHLDDRFETILLKMIRGTSLEGVSAFSMWNGSIFRPFLNFPKSELLAYAQQRNLKWVEDPSNQESDFLRNWLRNDWLKKLEDRVPGARANLARSLFKMIEVEGNDRTFEEAFLLNCDGNTLTRDWFSLLSPHNQIRALAMFLKRNNLHEFSTGQLEEIRKRLDKNQKELTFEMLSRKWVINATQIVIE